jgi:hypothetical protein
MNIKLECLLTTCCVLLQRRPTSRGGDASGRPHRFITMQQQVDHRLALFALIASEDERGDDQTAVDYDLKAITFGINFYHLLLIIMLMQRHGDNNKVEKVEYYSSDNH